MAHAAQPCSLTKELYRIKSLSHGNTFKAPRHGFDTRRIYPSIRNGGPDQAAVIFSAMAYLTNPIVRLKNGALRRERDSHATGGKAACNEHDRQGVRAHARHHHLTFCDLWRACSSTPWPPGQANRGISDKEDCHAGAGAPVLMAIRVRHCGRGIAI
jgi:hypothetical protein